MGDVHAVLYKIIKRIVIEEKAQKKELEKATETIGTLDNM